MNKFIIDDFDLKNYKKYWVDPVFKHQGIVIVDWVDNVVKTFNYYTDKETNITKRSKIHTYRLHYGINPNGSGYTHYFKSKRNNHYLNDFKNCKEL